MLDNEVGVSIEVARGIDTATKHDKIARVIKVVLGNTKKGEDMRKNAHQMKKKMEDALSSIVAINEFLVSRSSFPSVLSIALTYILE